MRAVESDAAGDDGVPVPDPHMVRLCQEAADLAISLSEILEIVGHERLSGHLADRRLVLRLKPDRPIGLLRVDPRHAAHKHGTPVDGTNPRSWNYSITMDVRRQGSFEHGLEIMVFQNNPLFDRGCGTIAGNKGT